MHVGMERGLEPAAFPQQVISKARPLPRKRTVWKAAPARVCGVGEPVTQPRLVRLDSGARERPEGSTGWEGLKSDLHRLTCPKCWLKRWFRAPRPADDDPKACSDLCGM